LRIVLITDLEFAGGATVAASRYCEAFKNLGHDVIRVIPSMETGRRFWEPIELFEGRKYKIQREFCEILGLQKLGDRLREKDLLKRLHNILAEVNPDIINVHNIHAVKWPLSLVEACLQHANVCWTLHDMWAFSGLYYTYEDLPKSEFPTSLPPQDQIKVKQFWDRFLALYNYGNFKYKLKITCPSAWLLMKAKKSYFNRFEGEKIQLSIPTDTFKPLSKKLCRKVLGLPEEDSIVLFAAANLKLHSKGFHYFAEIVKSINSLPFTLVVMGNGGAGIKNEFGRKNPKIKNMGYVTDDLLKCMIYNAADISVHPAPVDNHPTTVAESISSGTPVVAFSVGGLPELVIPGKTGWLVDQLCSKAFLQKILFAIDQIRNGKDYGTTCIEYSDAHLNLTKQAEKYIKYWNKY
jgi:glycosyltransferase involved in cell wall biosynthesis